MRDSYHVGTPEYGNIDAERIIDGFRVIDLRLCISSSALHAMMNSFRAIQSMYTAIYYHRTSRIFDFMIADALSNVPEFVTEITSSVDEFLNYDDCTVVSVIKERAQRKGSSGRCYEKALEILKKVRYRKKMYKCIFEFPLSFPLVVKKEPLEDIEKACKGIEKFCEENNAEDFNIRFDYRPAIRPVGIELDKIIKWLRSPVIYDTEDKKTKSLEEISEVYYRDLLRYSIVLRIFIDREKFENHPHIVRRIKDKAKEELKGLDWSKLL